LTIYFDPPRPHPRAGEKVKIKRLDGKFIEAQIHWIYGPNKFFMVSYKGNKYIEGMEFEIVPIENIEFLSNT
jgi:hypothetical protein